MRSALRFAALILLSALALQLYFLARVALMVAVDPQSSSFQRSEAWRLLTETHRLAWSQEWLSYPRLSAHLKRAVIASEDAGFKDHGGVEWDAIEKAWERNQKPAPARKSPAQAKVAGGSTITQQLAKNLFLDRERSLARKSQELVITFMLEALLSKQRILEIYLNSVEWGEGVFGAQAAARHYFRVDARGLGPMQAAQLAVMLPAPKRFEKRPGSPYVMSRAGTVAARMAAVEAP